MKVLVVEDEWLLRPGIVSTIKHLKPEAVVAEARSLKETFQQLRQTPQTQLILLDLQLEDSTGIDTLKSTRRWCSDSNLSPRIVVLSADKDRDLAREVLDNLSTGFILKSGSPEDFKLGIETTLNGQIHVPEHVKRGLSSGGGLDEFEDQFPSTFTPREAEVCRVIAGGALTYKDMANRMGKGKDGQLISPHTAKIFVWKAAAKLGIKKDIKASLIVAMARMKIRGCGGMN